MSDPFGLRPQEDFERAPTVLLLRIGLGLAAVVLVVAVLVAGAAGLLVTLTALTVMAAAVLALALPGAPARRIPRRPAPAVRDAPYRAYRGVAEQLSWAAVSPRHFDLVTRPLLTELAAARLADRHGVDLHREPAAAQALLGADVWPWVAPVEVPSRDGQPPGVDRATLTRIVDRLEQL